MDCPVVNIATGKTLLEAINILEDRAIPWENVIGFGSDSASVMVGRHNNIVF